MSVSYTHLDVYKRQKHNSTIIGVKNLEGFFRELRTKEKKYTKGTQMYLDQLRENSEEIRDKILRHIMIRRTRGEIKEYYADCLLYTSHETVRSDGTAGLG